MLTRNAQYGRMRTLNVIPTLHESINPLRVILLKEQNQIKDRFIQNMEFILNKFYLINSISFNFCFEKNYDFDISKENNCPEYLESSVSQISCKYNRCNCTKGYVQAEDGLNCDVDQSPKI